MEARHVTKPAVAGTQDLEQEVGNLLGNDRDGHGLGDSLDVVAVEWMSRTFLLQPANTSTKVTATSISAGWAGPKPAVPSGGTCRGRRWRPHPSSRSSGPG